MSEPKAGTGWIKFGLSWLAFGIGLICLGVAAFALTRVVHQGEPVNLSVLVGIPAAIGAIVSFITSGLHASKSASKPLRSSLPPTIALILFVLVAGGLILREGMICIAMLGPIWIFFGAIGWLIGVTIRLTKRTSATSQCAAILALPMAVMMYEHQFPPATEAFTVSRSIVIDAPPETIWPILLAMPEIGADEGRWNVAQDLFPIPRPSAAVVDGEGIGAIRAARWGDDITFEEHITGWEPLQAMTWRFVFPNDSVHKYTDEHLAPDGPHLRIEEGGYRLTATSDGRTRLTLYTRYEASTPVNSYSAVWGEIFLGGIQKNVLGIVKDRAETGS